MPPYATLADLRLVAADYDVTVPDDAKALRALDLASADLDRYLGAPEGFDLTLLTAVQVTALVDATCVQACFRLEQWPFALGNDDGVTTVTLSTRTPLRISPEAVERVSNVDFA